MKESINNQFRERIYQIVSQIPRGRVMTYGQIAALCGNPRAAWEVGQIAHMGPNELPWQRVVNRQGGLAVGWPYGGQVAHKQALEADGVMVSDTYKVDVEKLLWWPSGDAH